MKGQNGITLVALIITIIVLLILALVSISAITGNEGILTKSKNAVERHDQAVNEENSTIAGYETYIQNKLNEFTPAN